MISITFVLSLAACFKIGHSGGQSYALTFMNITSDGEDTVGFTQLFVYSKEAVRARILAMRQRVSPVVQVGADIGIFYNFTEDFASNEITIANEVTTLDNLGVAVFSGAELSVIGVKSDRGSTDAFLALKAVRSSKEFLIALWPNRQIFQGSIQVTGILNGTCVEIYKIFEGNKYVLVYSNSLYELEVLRFFQRYKIDQNGQQTSDYEDLTGYYINASRPVRVVVGHECARVPETVGYCDHMAEQIPAMSQLGRYYVVPPIAGRILNAGYIIRVVAAKKDSYTLVEIDANQQKVIRFGEFLEYDVSSNLKILIVKCNTSCLVMQYNKGFTAVSYTDDTPTDPFMMIVTPSDRFTAVAPFATPNYCDTEKHRTTFDNYLSIVTYKAYKDTISFDGYPIQTSKWTDVDDFSVASFAVTHDHHLLISNGGSFAAYVYGHSIMKSSPSGYGFAANYNVSGEAVDDGWLNSLGFITNYLLNQSSAYCANESTLLGKGVSNEKHASFPFQLTGYFNTSDLSEKCASGLKGQLGLAANNIKQKINEWICSQLNCSYLGSFGVAVSNISIFINKIDQGKYSGITVYVDVIASYSTQAKDYALCRLEIKDYLSYYRTWLNINQLLSKIDGCPASLNFQSGKLGTNSVICWNK